MKLLLTCTFLTAFPTVWGVLLSPLSQFCVPGLCVGLFSSHRKIGMPRLNSMSVCVFVFSSKEGQETAGERMTKDQGIKSYTHRDGCALSGTVPPHNQHLMSM